MSADDKCGACGSGLVDVRPLHEALPSIAAVAQTADNAIRRMSGTIAAIERKYNDACDTMAAQRAIIARLTDERNAWKARAEREHSAYLGALAQLDDDLDDDGIDDLDDDGIDDADDE